VPLSSLIAEEETHSTKINWQSNNSWTYQWIINFETIGEDSRNFQDPLTKTNYPFAYTEWIAQVNWESKSYRFMQMATINERNGTTQLVWNYFKYDEQDDESLFVDENLKVIESWKPPMIYDLDNETQSSDNRNNIEDSNNENNALTCSTWYYQEGESCTEVWIWYYSPASDTWKTQCPDWWTTSTTTASMVTECKKTVICTWLPSNANWNTVSSVTKNYDWSSYNLPNAEAMYSTEASAEECRFKCDTDYSWNSINSTCENITLWIACDSKYRYHPPNWTATAAYTWTPNSTSPSWTNCNYQRENPSRSTWEYNIPYDAWTHQYAFRCWGNTTFASYDYDTKLSQYPAFKACSDLWSWWRLPTKAELSVLHINKPTCSTLGLKDGEYYWSSTEYNSYNVLVMYMSDSLITTSFKTPNRYVVCVHD
jgi:hypothetical protein